MFGRKKRKEGGRRKKRTVEPPGPQILGIDEGGHGNAWSAIFGFEDDDHVGRSVEALFEGLEQTHAIGTSRARLESDHGALRIWGIGSKEGIETLYPVLAAGETVPVEIGAIVEWTHVSCPEAQIRGGGRGVFGLDFFAVDFAERKQDYRATEPLPIALSGLGYLLDEAGPMEGEFDEDFCAYLPNQDLPNGYEFDFIGTVLAAQRLELLGETFSFVKVRLIRDDENPEMFNLPILVNHKNLRCAPPKTGDRVSGCFRLQGWITDATS